MNAIHRSIRSGFLFFVLFVSTQTYAQNIGVNTTGAAPAAANLFEVLQPSNTASYRGIYTLHSGTGAGSAAIYAEHTGAVAGVGNYGYAFQAIKSGAGVNNIAAYLSATGGTNNYALIVPSGAGNVGIGTTAPTSKLVVADQDNAGVEFLQYNNGDGANIRAKRARGTIASPTAVLAGDRIAALTGFGHNGTDFVGQRGAFSIHAEENYTLTNNGTYLAFVTTPNGSTATAERLRITAAGNVGIGSAAPGYILDVTGTAHVDGLNVNGAYSLPTADGTANYVLKTDGSGTVAWTDPNTIVSADITAVNAGTGLVGGGSSGSVTLGIATTTDDDITDRAPTSTGLGSGFYQTATATTAEGWPETTNLWYHLINSQHSNTSNNYAMQFAGSFYNNNLFYRSTNGSGATAWDKIWHAGSDGSGSTLDADLLDGISSAGFIQNQTAADQAAGFRINGNGIFNGGSVGIGTTIPSGKLDIRPVSGTASVYFGSSADLYPRIYLGGTSATVAGVINRITTGATLYFGEDGDAGGYQLRGTGIINIGTGRLYIEGAGNIGIGTTTVSQKLTVNGRVKSNGINETSDARLKKEVVTIADALQKVNAIRGVNYFWKTEEFPDKGLDERKQMGVIAQEVEKVMPEVVITDPEGYKSVEYSKMVGVLIEAVKELSAKSEAQQGFIEKLSSENSVLKSENIKTKQELTKINHYLGISAASKK